MPDARSICGLGRLAWQLGLGFVSVGCIACTAPGDGQITGSSGEGLDFLPAVPSAMLSSAVVVDADVKPRKLDLGFDSTFAAADTASNWVGTVDTTGAIAAFEAIDSTDYTLDYDAQVQLEAFLGGMIGQTNTSDTINLVTLAGSVSFAVTTDGDGYISEIGIVSVDGEEMWGDMTSGFEVPIDHIDDSGTFAELEVSDGGAMMFAAFGGGSQPMQQLNCAQALHSLAGSAGAYAGGALAYFRALKAIGRSAIVGAARGARFGPYGAAVGGLVGMAFGGAGVYIYSRAVNEACGA